MCVYVYIYIYYSIWIITNIEAKLSTNIILLRCHFPNPSEAPGQLLLRSHIGFEGQHCNLVLCATGAGQGAAQTSTWAAEDQPQIQVRQRKLSHGGWSVGALLSNWKYLISWDFAEIQDEGVGWLRLKGKWGTLETYPYIFFLMAFFHCHVLGRSGKYGPSDASPNRSKKWNNKTKRPKYWSTVRTYGAKANGSEQTRVNHALQSHFSGRVRLYKVIWI